MLGTIAKKLRIFGFDCRYHCTIQDDDLVLAAKKEERTIITKDVRLATNANQYNITTIHLKTHTEKEQLIEIAHKLDWKKFDLSYSRCSLCNGILKKVPKQLVIEKIPPKITEHIDEFWKCKDCSHVYWVGTHIRNLEKLIAEINDCI